MRKFPSPSVVCAQNSPTTFTTGFTRSRSTSRDSTAAAQARSASTVGAPYNWSQMLVRIPAVLAIAGREEIDRQSQAGIQSAACAS